MFFKLFKIFASNIFSFDSIADGFKNGAKGIAKSVGIILLFLYVICCFGGMYIFTMISEYKMLESAGQTFLMPVVSFFIIFLVIAFFGFTSVATNYYTNSGEEQFLSMPISPTAFFGAKFAVSFVTDAVLGILLFAAANFVYAFNSGLLKNPLFYVGTAVSAVVISLVTVLLIYFLFILPLYFFSVLRKRKVLTAIASVFLIFFGVIYAFLYTKIGAAIGGGDAQDLFQPILNFSVNVSQKIPFLIFVSDAINGKIIPILFLLAVSAVCIFVLVPAAACLYVKTLNGFSDVKTKKMTQKKAREIVQKNARKNSVFKTLFIRDVRQVLREPTFFVNGPLMIFLLPLILLLSFSVGLVATMENPVQEFPQLLFKLKEKIGALDISFLKYCVSAGGAIFTVFIGNLSSVAITSFSREGKSLFDLKSMPIKNEIIVKVKFWHAFFYILIADVITIFILIILNLILHSPLAFFDFISVIFLMSLNVFSVSLVLVLCDMFVDTANPKLLWENPSAAFKQNLNTLAGVLLNSVVLCVLIVLVFFVLPKNQTAQIFLTAVFVIIAAPIGSKYFKYAEKRILLM